MRLALILIALVLLGAPRALADEDVAPVEDAERDAAIAGAVRYLDKHVLKLPKVHGTPRKPFIVATYGIVKLLASDAGRTTAKRRDPDLKKVIRFLVDYIDQVAERLDDPLQLPSAHGRVQSGGVVQYNWPLGIAAIFFSELHARGLHRATALEANRKIVAILLDGQQENGGFGHGRIRELMQVTGMDDELQEKLEEELGKVAPGVKAPKLDGYPATLIASTNVVGLGLGVARRAHGSEPFGEAFDPALERVVEYFDDAQLVSGNFPYDPSQRSAGADKTGIPRAGGAIAAMLALGVSPRSKEVRRAADTVDDGLAYLNEGHGSSTLGLCLSALGMHLRGAEPWRRFKQAFFRMILDAQADSGVFGCVCEGKAFGSTNDDRPLGVSSADTMTRVYVTALTTWILLLDRAQLQGVPPEETPEAQTTPK